MESKAMIEGYIEPNDLMLALHGNMSVRLYSNSYRDNRYKVIVPLSSIQSMEAEGKTSNIKIYVKLEE